MAIVHAVKYEDIQVLKTRQRKEFKPEDIVALAGSISKLGLLHPPVVRKGDDGSITLVAGECRIRAMHILWNFGDCVRYGEHTFPEQVVPCNYIGEIDLIDAFEIELEENIRRMDLTWMERAEATKKLMEHRQAQATRDGTDQPTVESIAAEVRGESNSSRDQTRKELLVANHLADPEVQKARNADDAFKLLKRREALARNVELAAKVGVNFSTQSHTLQLGNSLDLMKELPDGYFDVLLTDPPYGIDADQFSDSGGIAQGSHFYDDSWTYWNNIVRVLAAEAFRFCKPQSHAYVFCDVDNFVLLKNFFTEAGWKVFRTPLVWINPTAARAPWPEHGPQRKYQICLYALKGDRPVTRIYPDVMVYASDENLNHQAQKPVALYTDLLARSVSPGDTCVDPFGGTGPILPAAHELKCKATYIERDPAQYGNAINRLKGLDQ